MSASERFLKFAAECELMAKFTSSLENKVTWHRMAERWVRCGWSEVPGRGQPQRTVAGPKRDDGLHRALAEGARADERGALVVPQRPGDDFRRRRRTAVDQQDERLALGQVARSRVSSELRHSQAMAGAPREKVKNNPMQGRSVKIHEAS